MNLFKKEKLEEATLKLGKYKSQKYLIDPHPKAHIAQVKKDRRIYVNMEFLKLSKKEQLAIIYHERGHSNFILFKWVNLLQSFYFPLSLLFTLIGLMSLMLYSLSRSFLVIGFALMLVGILLFLGFVFLFWLVEVIADSNAVKIFGKEQVIKTVEKQYLNKRIGWWRRNIEHPPWKLRKRIMLELD